MIADGVGFKRFIGSKSLPHIPVHVVVKALGADASMPVIQTWFRGSMTVIQRLEMPRSPR